MATLSAEEFEAMTGFAPRQDDLTRANCPRVGGIGHYTCGICSDHEKPRFVCGCIVIPAPLDPAIHAVE